MCRTKKVRHFYLNNMLKQISFAKRKGQNHTLLIVKSKTIIEFICLFFNLSGVTT